MFENIYNITDETTDEVINEIIAWESEQEEHKIWLPVTVVTELGSYINTEIKVSEDYTMNEVARAIKSMGYVRFRIIGSMKAFARV